MVCRSCWTGDGRLQKLVRDSSSTEYRNGVSSVFKLAAYAPPTTIVMRLSLAIQERSSEKCAEKRKLRNCIVLGWLRCEQQQSERRLETSFWMSSEDVL